MSVTLTRWSGAWRQMENLAVYDGPLTCPRKLVQGLREDGFGVWFGHDRICWSLDRLATGDGEGCWGQVVQRTVRAMVVVLPAVVRDEHLGFLERLEHLPIEKLV